MRVSSRISLCVLLVSALVLGGCATTKDPRDKLSTVMRIHLESQEDQLIPPKPIAVFRESPLLLSVESLYLATEENLVSARIINQMGTYAIELKFDQWTSPLLSHNSSSWQGRRIAIQAQWGPKHEYTRWLAAPVMDRHITDGTLTFTPDASLEEVQDIVTGLNNAIRKTRKPLEW